MHWDLCLVVGLTILFAVFFAVANGWNDAANAIATVVSTRTMAPWAAVAMGAVMNLVGAFISGKVANTVGGEIVDHRTVTLPATVFLAAVMVAPLWAVVCTLRGLPISCSHSLLGGLIGAVGVSAGWSALQGGQGLYKILFGVLISPVMGFVLGYLMMLALSWIFRRLRPTTATSFFGKLHILSAGSMALAHGAGDAQPPMGIIAGALVAGGFLTRVSDDALPMPWWIKLTCALAMAVGTALGGRAVIKTLGSGLSKLKHHQGFSASAGAATTILVNIMAKGIPVSTTHSITGAIAGAGATSGLRSVKWGVGRKIVTAWVLTFPACILGGAVLYWLLRLIFPGLEPAPPAAP
ncbi:MAG TPA: inorganic phosphate transporter [Planctomycetota bacterium]|nr:inorganic phosphate transporter [Planctomycetota bacterium]